MRGLEAAEGEKIKKIKKKNQACMCICVLYSYCTCKYRTKKCLQKNGIFLTEKKGGGVYFNFF